MNERSAQLPTTLEHLVSGLPDSTAAEVREGLATAFGEEAGAGYKVQRPAGMHRDVS